MENIIPYYNDNKLRDIYVNWKSDFLKYFGQSLGNLINILDPDVIVLGGGLSNIEFLYEEGIKSVYNSVFSDVIDTPILKNKLGDSSGVLGAALLGHLG